MECACSLPPLIKEKEFRIINWDGKCKARNLIFSNKIGCERCVLEAIEWVMNSSWTLKKIAQRPFRVELASSEEKKSTTFETLRNVKLANMKRRRKWNKKLLLLGKEQHTASGRSEISDQRCLRSFPRREKNVKPSGRERFQELSETGLSIFLKLRRIFFCWKNLKL